MEFEEVGRVWREQGTGAIRRTVTEDLGSVLQRARKEGTARRRRFGKVAWIVAVPLVLFFTYMAWRAPNLLAGVGAILMAGLAALVAGRYRAIGRREADASLPVREAIEKELAHLETIGRFRRDAPKIRAMYWTGFGIYVLGVAMADGGFEARASSSVGIFLLMLITVEGLIYFGRRWRSQSGGSLEEVLRSWLDSLDELDPQDGGGPPASTDPR